MFLQGHHALIFCLVRNSSIWLWYCTWSSRKKRFPLQYTKRTNTIENTLQPNVQILWGRHSPWWLLGHTNRGRGLTEMFVTSIVAESCSLQWSQTLMVVEQSDLFSLDKRALNDWRVHRDVRSWTSSSMASCSVLSWSRSCRRVTSSEFKSEVGRGQIMD